MKRIAYTSLFAVIILCSAAIAPKKTKEKDIIGKWKFHLSISNAIDEETEGDDDLGSLFARGIGRLVDDLVEEVDITFDFQKNNILVVTENSDLDDDDEPTVETYRWKINKKGHVITTPIKKKSKKRSVQNSDGWKLKKGKLVPVDNDDKDVVWMERIED
jgi:hypothetical protein